MVLARRIAALASASLPGVLALGSAAAVLLPRATRRRAELRWFTAGAGLAALGLSCAAWLRTRRRVRNIRRLTDSARRVSPANLEPFRGEASDAELVRLESELNAALARVRTGLESQTRFVRAVAHELKTPLSVLVAEAGLVRQGLRGPEASRAFVARVDEDLRHLAKLVDGLGSLARLEEDGTERGLVYADDVLRVAVQGCSALAQERGVVLVTRPVAEGSPDPFVVGDFRLLTATLETLLRHALEHAPSGAPLTIEACSQDGAVRWTVTDPAPVGAQSLALLHEIARRHGGDLRVAAADGTSRFELTLPRARVEG